MNEINKRVRACRRVLGLNQTDVATRMGIKCNTYSQKERTGHITAEELIKLAEILNVDAHYLLYGTKKEEPAPTPPIELPNPEPKPREHCITPPLSPKEITFTQMLRYMSKKKRLHVMEYAYKVFKNKIEID